MLFMRKIFVCSSRHIWRHCRVNLIHNTCFSEHHQRSLLPFHRYLSFSTMADEKLCFSEFSAFGVDLDHTLCKYKLDNLFPHVYDSIMKILVEDFGYDKELLFPFYDHRDFCFKGLVIDTKKGNLLKFTEDGTITRASHGTTALTFDEIEAYYPGGKFKHFDYLKETLHQLPEYRYFENFFDMPIMLVCCRIVDSLDKKAGKRLDEYDFIKDVTSAAGRIWRRESFAEDAYYFFPGLKKEPSKYMQKCSPKLSQWLKSIKDSGKIVFLLTSSHVDYAKFLLEYILGPDYLSYFNICITWARKPGFFMNDDFERPFYTIENNTEGTIIKDLESNTFYSQGNVHTFHKYLEKVTGLAEPKILYCGDSIRSDIFPVTKFGHWTSVLILEEMEAEGLVETDGQPKAKVQKIEGPSGTEKEYLMSDFWGSFFTDDTIEGQPGAKKGPPQMNTLWSHFIKTYASIAAPQLDYFIDLPMDHKFVTFQSDSTGLAGFFPCPPITFKDSI